MGRLEPIETIYCLSAVAALSYASLDAYPRWGILGFIMVIALTSFAILGSLTSLEGRYQHDPMKERKAYWWMFVFIGIGFVSFIGILLGVGVGK